MDAVAVEVTTCILLVELTAAEVRSGTGFDVVAIGIGVGVAASSMNGISIDPANNALAFAVIKFFVAIMEYKV